MQIQFLRPEKCASVILLCTTDSKPLASLSASFLLSYPLSFFFCSLSFSLSVLLLSLHAELTLLRLITPRICVVLHDELMVFFFNSCQCYFQCKSCCLSFFLSQYMPPLCSFLYASFWVHLTFFLLFTLPLFLLLFHYFLLFSSLLLLLVPLSASPALPPHQLTWTCPLWPLTLIPWTWMLRSPLSSRVTLAPPRACQAA